MKKTWTIFIVVLIMVGAGTFYAGDKYGASKNTVGTANSQFAARTGARQGGAGTTRGAGAAAAGGGMVAGQVVTKDQTTITVQAGNNAGSKVILYTSSTSVRKTVDITTKDVMVGQNISVRGTANSDGSITANSIQLVPAGATSSTGQGFGGGF